MKTKKKGYLTEILVSGGVFAILALSMTIAELEHYQRNIDTEWYIGAIAIGFLFMGIWAGFKWRKLKESEPPILPDVSSFDLSKRETEVFHLLVQGKSNKEISDELSVSLSTIKTHVSNILVKMNVKSRAQAIALIQQTNA